MVKENHGQLGHNLQVSTQRHFRVQGLRFRACFDRTCRLHGNSMGNQEDKDSGLRL